MKPSDIPGFFANIETLNKEDYILLDYYFECIGDPEASAAHLCSEQSTAQWKRVDVDEDFRTEFGAKVIDLKIHKKLDDISYPVQHNSEGDIFACHAKIAYPHKNFGPKIPNLMSAVCGEGTFFTPGIPVIKLLNIHFPESYLAAFDGPKFGISGIREMLNVYDRPIFFGVIKPNIGLSPEPFAEIGYQGWLGGLDIAKDDEMLADASWSSVKRRSELLGAARKKAEVKTGTSKIYLANITDEVDRLVELHDIAVENGANALLLNTMPIGLSAIRMLRKHNKVPIIAHFPFIAAFSRLEKYGVHSKVITKLQRLVGYDAVIMPGFGPRMMTTEEEVKANVEACLEDMGHIKPVLPVPGGSDWAGTLKRVYEKVGSVDFGFVPGRGVFGHPMGPAAGAKSINQAWEAISKKIPLEEYASTNPELKSAIETFSKK